MSDWISRYSNFATIGTCVLMLAAGLITSDRKLRAMEASIETALSMAEEEKEKNEQQDKTIADQTVILTKLEVLVGAIYERGLIIPKGKAFVMEAPGDAYLELNVSDVGASRLLGFDRLKVTNMSHPDRPSAIIKVGPTFSNLTPDYVLQLSTEAGALLHAADGKWIQIRVEPVF